MKKLILLLCLFLAACSTATPVLPTSNTEPTATIEPTNTREPTRTPAPTRVIPTIKPYSPTKPHPTIKPYSPLTTPISIASRTPTQQVEKENIQVFEGEGDKVFDIPPAFGSAVLIINHRGTGYFYIKGYDKSGSPAGLLVNTIGKYSGRRPLNLLKGEQVTRLEVKSSGKWNVIIFPFEGIYLNVCMVPGKCEGTGDDMVAFAINKPDTATFHYSGDGNFAVWGYSNTKKLLINEIGAYDGQILLGDVTMMEIIASGAWTADITSR